MFTMAEVKPAAAVKLPEHDVHLAYAGLMWLPLVWFFYLRRSFAVRAVPSFADASVQRRRREPPLVHPQGEDARGKRGREFTPPRLPSLMGVSPQGGVRGRLDAHLLATLGGVYGLGAIDQSDNAPLGRRRYRSAPKGVIARGTAEEWRTRRHFEHLARVLVSAMAVGE